MNDNLANLQKEYYEALLKHNTEVGEEEYEIFEKHKVFLEQMARVNNSGITVFDLNKKEHVYASYNLFELFGYETEKIASIGNDYFTSKIHPEDCLELMKIGTSLFNFGISLPKEQRKDYKVQNEFRILNQHGVYKRVIEQHIILELDKNGNFWLVLSVMDISPVQQENQGVISQMVNVKTGEVSDFSKIQIKDLSDKTELTKRETEILQLVKIGSLSKEISDSLSISVHTVNTHRQKILQKLNANNSFEAVGIASNLGLI